ncbi:MAG: DUF1203 domain-containing protein [Pseudomonadota bacterium]|nr:DUF1203 domain-containing protein [Pseudomonadota bacterium]
MCAFQLAGLPAEPFHALFDLSDAELGARQMRRIVATSSPGFPCRVSLADAAVGDELILLPYQHQAAGSPYQASGPIFVRRGAVQRVLPAGVVPEYVSTRLISVRAYDPSDMIIGAEVCEGEAVASSIERIFVRTEVRYIHLHNAKRGCFSCLVQRA